VRGGEDSPDSLRILEELDAFENTWFPRVHAIIRRVVPADARDEFELAFFKDLVQQPFGPGVVRSVGTLCSRVEGLATTEQPHAKEVAGTLAARGFDSAKIAELRQLIGTIELRAQPQSPNVDGDAIRQAQQAQRDAMEKLRDWFSDWATTLRPIFSTLEQIQMGLTVTRRDATPKPATAPGGAGPNGASPSVPANTT